MTKKYAMKFSSLAQVSKKPPASIDLSIFILLVLSNNHRSLFSSFLFFHSNIHPACIPTSSLLRSQPLVPHPQSGLLSISPTLNHKYILTAHIELSVKWCKAIRFPGAAYSAPKLSSSARLRPTVRRMRRSMVP